MRDPAARSMVRFRSISIAGSLEHPFVFWLIFSMPIGSKKLIIASAPDSFRPVARARQPNERFSFSPALAFDAVWANLQEMPTPPDPDRDDG